MTTRSTKQTDEPANIGSRKAVSFFSPARIQTSLFFPAQSRPLQRKCDHCEEEEQQLQRKESADGGMEVSESTGSYIDSLSGKGSPLSSPERSFFEPRLGYDFSGVRLHTNTEANQSAKELNAYAYAHGENVVFAAGQYNPHTDEGKRLMAHELTHVVQQNADTISPCIQRRIAVSGAAIVPTHLASTFMTPAQRQDTPPEYIDQSCGFVAADMLNKLCPEGQWTVDRSTGVASSGSQDLCTGNGAQSSGHPTSCGCLCELTGAGSQNVVVHITDEEIDELGNTSGVSGSLAQHGQGLTRTDLSVPLAGRVFHVAVSGLSFQGTLGVGDNTVAPDAHGQKRLRDPGWLILGHEMCGHVRKDLSQPGGRAFEHTMSEDYNTSAVDVENAIRREHSTATDNYGIRFGNFQDFSGCNHFGLVYQIKFGARVTTLHSKFNIPEEFNMSQDADSISATSFLNCQNRTFDPHTPQRVFKHVFAYRPDEPVVFIMSDCGNFSFTVGDKVFLEGVFAHRVITGDTKTSIARMWNVTLDKLSVANQDITPNYNSFTNTDPLPAGMSIIIPYDRNAASTFMSC